jgi:hypothetical protein
MEGRPQSEVLIRQTRALSYAATNMPLTTSYTAIAQDTYGRRAWRNETN